MTPFVSRRALLAAAALSGLLVPQADARIISAANEARFASAAWRQLSPDQWRARLSAAAFDVLRMEGTERAGTSALNNEHRRGVFVCAGCELELFRSQWKFDSGTGWPSFYRVIETNVGTTRDTQLGYARTEYHCAQCLGHQGHVFDDGPQPTGLRYCNNGVALRFTPTR